MNEAPIADERERRIFEAVMTLARSYRDDRERLVRRLSAVEHALDVLTLKVDLRTPGSPGGTPTAAAPPPAPSRTPS
jgi:hypothetical protein